MFNALFNACLLTLLFLSTTSLAQERKTYSLPFRAERSLILVSVTIDGQPKTLIFDTGAERTLIHKLGDSVERRVVVILPGRTLTNFPVIQADLSNMPLTKVGADGVLGQDVLRKFSAVRIDFKHDTVELEQ